MTRTHPVGQHSLIEDLNQLLRLTDQQGTTSCFALIRLESLQKIKTCYGNGVIDGVLTSLEVYLRQSFRSQDVLMRWEQEEFFLGIYDISKEIAIQRINDLSLAFSQDNYISNQKRLFHVSFSSTVAEYPQDGKDIQTLYNYARRVLLRSKVTDS
ncbi:MAG: diguanylate cyclase [Leptolyngbyaceae cyanobacterium MAG.088]|nr:diguanylate cyclase [Leptolyngbyaceae cyanobacterium MAG.088]